MALHSLFQALSSITFEDTISRYDDVKSIRWRSRGTFKYNVIANTHGSFGSVIQNLLYPKFSSQNSLWLGTRAQKKYKEKICADIHLWRA